MRRWTSAPYCFVQPGPIFLRLVAGADLEPNYACRSMVKRGATAIAPHAVRRLEDRTRGLTRNVCSPTQSRHSTSREADIYRPLLDGLRKVAASLRTHRCKSHDIENAEQKQIVLLGRDRLRSKRWHGLPAFLHRLDPEPDGVQGRQKHEGEHCSAERSSDQGICEGSPKHRMR